MLHLKYIEAIMELVSLNKLKTLVCLIAVNTGGSGMIGIQEMLLQADGDKIHLFPAWPANHDVHFKLNAPKSIIIEAKLKNGKIEFIKVIPEERRKDIVSVFQK